MLADIEPCLSDGGVGRRGKCSMEEEAREDLVMIEGVVNLKRPFSLAPNWEAEVDRDRVPEEGKVGELEPGVDVVIGENNICVMSPRRETRVRRSYPEGVDETERREMRILLMTGERKEVTERQGRREMYREEKDDSTKGGAPR